MEVELGDTVGTDRDDRHVLLEDADAEPQSSAPWGWQEMQLSADGARTRRELGFLRLVVGVLAVAVVIQAVVIAVVMLSVMMRRRGQTPPPTAWTTFAARLQACSGHGTEYSYDSVVWCECLDCWSGSQCQLHDDATCDAQASAGDPLLFEEYWASRQAVADVLLESAHKIGYVMGEEPTGPYSTMARLEMRIRELHRLVGNVDTHNVEIVVGAGSTQLNAAAVHVLASRAATAERAAPAQVWAAVPYYGAYKISADFAQSRLYEWAAGGQPEANATHSVIEFVTSPNNPDGSLRTPTVPGATVVYDSAYYWPHYVPITEPRSPQGSDMLIFTLSKLTGHAGTRIGWAVVRDAEVAAAMRQYLATTILHVPRESQDRAYTLLTHLVHSQGELLEWAAAQMQYKWDQLKAIFGRSSRFVLETQLQPTAECSFLRRPVGPSPAYAWIRCTRPEDVDGCDSAEAAMGGYRGLRLCGCARVMKHAGIAAVPGSFYGADAQFTRLELLQRRADFDLLAERLERLVAADPYR